MENTCHGRRFQHLGTDVNDLLSDSLPYLLQQLGLLVFRVQEVAVDGRSPVPTEFDYISMR